MPVYLWKAGADRGDGSAVEARLRAVIPDLQTVSGIEAARSRAAASGYAYVIVTTSNLHQGEFDALVDVAARERSRMFLILISQNISIDDYKRLVQTEGGDWAGINTDFREVADLISRHQARALKAAHPTDRKPVVISFVPSAGGVGNTTLAVETGIHLKTDKAISDRKICLIDLDFQSSNVCDYLDIEPRLQVQEISSDPGRLDAQLFEIFISRHASGLDVFAAPRTKFEYCQLDVSALDALLDMAAARYDLILIDCPVTWFAWTPRVIATSNAVLVAGINTVPGLRQLVETLAAIRRLPQVPSQLAVAMNRSQRRLLGGVARRHHVETALGNEQIFYISEEPMALESINTGSPMAMSKSYRAMGKDIAALAAFCRGISATRAVPR
jgi:pilus assembly protein CpaE